MDTRAWDDLSEGIVATLRTTNPSLYSAIADLVARGVPRPAIEATIRRGGAEPGSLIYEAALLTLDRLLDQRTKGAEI
jgi:hypothetical protein